jgi:hypothetical protein
MASARKNSTVLLATTLTATVATLVTARTAQADDDDAGGDASATATASAPRPEFGIAARIRNVRVPESLIQLFVDDAPDAVSQAGFGLELARRKGNFELQLGLEYDRIHMQDGVWIEKDKPIPANEPDFVEFDGFGWLSLEVNFINHTELASNFYLRYGGGIGLGILLGEIRRTDLQCTTDDPDSCSEYAGAVNQDAPYDLKTPVIPIVTGLVGLQYRAGGNLAFNLEGGIRTVPFWGGSIGYYF